MTTFFYTRKIWVLLLLPMLLACSAEDGIRDEEPTPAPAATPITVKASLPDASKSRAQVTYGNENEDYEIFMWNDDDEIYLFNISHFFDSEQPVFVINNIDGLNADFKIRSDYATKYFPIEKGDVILAVYGLCNGINSKYYKDPRNYVNIVVGTEQNAPQVITSENPDDAEIMFLQENFKMYDIVRVEEDGVIPVLNFKHLSALFRVTVTNASGEDFYPTKIEFHYPGTDSFYNVTMYMSVTEGEDGEINTEILGGDEFYTASSKQFTGDTGVTLNCKNGTDDAGRALKNGETYEFYVTTVPSGMNNDPTVPLSIHLIKEHQTKTPFVATIDAFKGITIEPGLRYWFELTLTPTGELMLNSEWEAYKKEHGDTPKEEENPTPES
ncbi:MAG: hypothetical protein K2M12_03495 [Muribaculaceae bacterium]|nr:hypothetical protein [Muribaculaceae bacterium]